MKIQSTKDISNERVFGLIAGVSGIGKTSLVKTLDPKNTLICSAENGLLSLAGFDYPVVVCKTTKDIADFIETVKSGVSYENIFVDSITEILDVVLSELKSKYSKKQTFDMWDEYNLVGDYVLKSLRDVKNNCFITCLTKEEKDGLSWKESFDFKGNYLQGRIKAYFDLCLHYKIENYDSKNYRVLITDTEASSLAKDRSGKLSSREEPNLGKIITKILSKGV